MNLTISAGPTWASCLNELNNFEKAKSQPPDVAIYGSDGISREAHSQILMLASTVLKDKLSQSIIPGSYILEFGSIESSTWEHLLQLIYEGEVNVDQVGLQQLLQAAHELEMPELVTVCQEKLETMKASFADKELYSNHFQSRRGSMKHKIDLQPSRKKLFEYDSEDDSVENGVIPFTVDMSQTAMKTTNSLKRRSDQQRSLELTLQKMKRQKTSYGFAIKSEDREQPEDVLNSGSDSSEHIPQLDTKPVVHVTHQKQRSNPEESHLMLKCKAEEQPLDLSQRKENPPSSQLMKADHGMKTAVEPVPSYKPFEHLASSGRSEPKSFGNPLQLAQHMAAAANPDAALMNMMQSLNPNLNMFHNMTQLTMQAQALYYQQLMQQLASTTGNMMMQSPVPGVPGLGFFPNLSTSTTTTTSTPDKAFLNMPPSPISPREAHQIPKVLKRRPFKAGNLDDEKLRKFVCCVCGERFKTRHVKDQHQLIHYDKRPYKCNICGFQAKQKAVIWRHKRKRHPNADTNVTMDCITDVDHLPDDQELLAQLSPHSSKPKQDTAINEASNTSRASPNNHTQFNQHSPNNHTHFNQRSPNNHAQLNQQTYLPSPTNNLSSPISVYEKANKPHPEGNEFENSLTQSATRRNPALEPILKMSQQIIENPMNEESHTMMASMIQSAVLIHTQMNPAFPHVNIPGFNPLKPWICYICFTGFKNKYILSQHMNTHSDARPYVCKICGFRAKQMSVIHNHKTNKHDYNADKKRGRRGRRGDDDNQTWHIQQKDDESMDLSTGFKPDSAEETIQPVHQVSNLTMDKVSLDKVIYPQQPEKTTDLPAAESGGKQVAGVNKSEELNTWSEMLQAAQLESKAAHSKQCQVCHKACFSKDIFVLHKLMHYGIGRYNCRFCKFQGLYFGQLSKHVKVFHKGMTTQFNQFCLTVFSNKPHLNASRKTFFTVKCYTCHICHQRFASKEVYKMHKLIHFEYKRYACGYCGKQSHSPTYVTRHIKMNHPTLDLMIIDQMANYQVSSHQNGTEISSSTISTDIVKEVMDKDSAVCTDDALNDSFDPIKNPVPAPDDCLFPNNKHPEYSEDFIATTGVPVVYDEKQNPVAQFTTTGTRQLPFRCPFCGRVFRLRHVEEQHRYIHQPFRKYECEYCGFRAKQKAVLYRHRQTKHANEPGVLKPKKGKRSQSPIMPLSWTKKNSSLLEDQFATKSNLMNLSSASLNPNLVPGFFQQFNSMKPKVGGDSVPPLIPVGSFPASSNAALQNLNQAWIFQALSQVNHNSTKQEVDDADMPTLYREKPINPRFSSPTGKTYEGNARATNYELMRSTYPAPGGESASDSDVSQLSANESMNQGQRTPPSLHTRSRGTDLNGNYSSNQIPEDTNDLTDDIDEATGMLKCKICLKLFGHKHVFREHKISHLPKDHKPYKCDECDHTSRHKASLWRHKQKQHSPTVLQT